MAATPDVSVVGTDVADLTSFHRGKLSPGPGRSALEVATHQRARIHRAMVEAVADNGYRGTTVRRVTSLAGVSSKAFYKLFNSKEDCFLCTYELLVQQAIKRILALQASGHSWEERVRFTLRAFALELEYESEARFILVEACSAGERGFARVRWAEDTFGAIVAEGFANAPNGAIVSPTIVAGIVAGVSRAVRSRLVRGCEIENLELGEKLADWALCFGSKLLSGIAEFEQGATLEFQAPAQLTDRTFKWTSDAQAHENERGLILSAVGRLAAADKSKKMSIAMILATAGLQRRAFNEHFTSLEDCYLALLEFEISRTMASACQVHRDRSSECNLHQTFVTFCTEIAKNPLFNNSLAADAFAFAPSSARSERIIGSFTSFLRDALPGSAASDGLTIEVSAGAIWGVLQRYIFSQRTCQLPTVAGALTVLALGPMVGTETAAVIRTDQLTEVAVLGQSAKLASLRGLT